MAFSTPEDLAAYLVEKGSVTLDGVSLTISRAAGRPIRGGPDPPHLGGNDPRISPARRPPQPRDRRPRQIRPPSPRRPRRPSLRGHREASLRIALQLPEPSRFWVRYTPRAWPCLRDPWTHVGNGSLGEGHPRSAAQLAADPSPVPPLDDLLYLPPVEASDRENRNRQALACIAQGTPVMVQLLPGESVVPGALALYDPLSSLLDGRLRDLEGLPAGCTVVWPLIAGLTDDRRLWREGCGPHGGRRRGPSPVPGPPNWILPSAAAWLRTLPKKPFTPSSTGRPR